MIPELQDKLDRLRQIIRECSSLLVAFSGGVDSSLVALVARQELGNKALACIGVSPSLPERERQQAIELAQGLGIAYRQVRTREHLDPRYAANAPDRCYFCKSELLDQLRSIAEAEGWGAVADGNNAGDAADHQGGMRAAAERGVRSPLIEAGLVKPEIRALARELGIPAWDKPSSPCLSSRVPHGTAITTQLLQQVERAEDALARLGFGEFRVRHHGAIARIELPVADLPRAIEQRQAIVVALRQAGYTQVTLDLAGLRSGGAGRAGEEAEEAEGAGGAGGAEVTGGTPATTEDSRRGLPILR